MVEAKAIRWHGTGAWILLDASTDSNKQTTFTFSQRLSNVKYVLAYCYEEAQKCPGEVIKEFRVRWFPQYSDPKRKALGYLGVWTYIAYPRFSWVLFLGGYYCYIHQTLNEHFLQKKLVMSCSKGIRNSEGKVVESRSHTSCTFSEVRGKMGSFTTVQVSEHLYAA